jgi:hypothetical protein
MHMNSKATPIEHTTFSDYFDGVSSNEVYQLDKEEANFLWVSNIDDKAKSYFDLPDENWLVEGSETQLGDWQRAYNEGDNESVASVLESSFGWIDNNSIFFCISKDLILRCTWKIFLEHWDSFVAAEDDCPIIFSEHGEDSAALIIMAIGDICRIDRKGQREE